MPNKPCRVLLDLGKGMKKIGVCDKAEDQRQLLTGFLCCHLAGQNVEAKTKGGPNTHCGQIQSVQAPVQVCWGFLAHVHWLASCEGPHKSSQSTHFEAVA